MKKILLISVALIFGVFISRCGDNSKLRFDKIEHFTVIIDSLELKKEVYVVKIIQNRHLNFQRMWQYF